MNGTVLHPHTCPHNGQDRLHGKGVRVWNFTLNGRRCTVCGEIVKSGKESGKESGKK